MQLPHLVFHVKASSQCMQFELAFCHPFCQTTLCISYLRNKKQKLYSELNLDSNKGERDALRFCQKIFLGRFYQGKCKKT